MPTKLTKLGYDSLNENEEGITFIQPIEEMTIKEIQDELEYLREQSNKKQILNGYSVDTLMEVAQALRSNEITIEILKDSFSMSCSSWNSSV